MLEISGLRKRYGGTIVLRGIDVKARPGEIVGIAGPNGAGKSTLVHILSGEVKEDAGAISFNGQRLEAADRQRLVSVVHQELQLFPTLTVLENLLIRSSANRLFRPAPSSHVRSIAAEFGILDVGDRPLDTCSVVVKQLTEIARAILHESPVILLDEPNSALTDIESERLFREVSRLKEEARTTILLVSHRLGDLVRYCDRVLVVREGLVARELQGADLTTSHIGRTIVGNLAAVVDTIAPERGVNSGGAAGDRSPFASDVLDVRGWSDAAGAAFSNVDLTVPAGEAVFITGQEGAGGREIVQSLAGIRRARGTVVALPRSSGRPLCYVPGDRATSLFPNLSVLANLAVRLEPDVLGSGGGVLKTGAMRRIADDLIQQFNIKTAHARAPVGVLSGGAQQKVAIGSAFAARPKLLILEDPTRGVDISAREQIARALRQFVAEGNSILGFSPELDEVFELADVVHVAMHGQLSAPNRSVRDEPLEDLVKWVDDVNRGDERR